MTDRGRLRGTVRRPSVAYSMIGLFALAFTGCTQTYDAGWVLPVDRRNPMILMNDGHAENWQGEYAMLLANGGGTTLIGIIVGTGGIYSKIEENFTAWENMVKAAKASGLRDIPFPIRSDSELLKRPTSGKIDETIPNHSMGALTILDLARQFALPQQPLVIVTGGRLTDVADAYLIDNSITDRVVVVSALGSLSANGAVMGEPNGEMDTWADRIVTDCFRYVQVSAYYDQTADIPPTRFRDLPKDNEFTNWIEAKQPGIWELQVSADQVAVLAVGVPGFVTDVARISPAESGDAGSTGGRALIKDPKGSGWLVEGINPTAARKAIWGLLQAPSTFKP